MQDRRGGRPSHVRPRSPSSGRPAPVKVRPRAPSPGRLGTYRDIERSGHLPLPARLLLVVAVAALGVAVLFTATGGLGRAVASLGDTVGGMLDGLTATPTPAPTVAVVPDAPTILAPEEPYTNRPSVDLVVTLPRDVVGDDETVVRVYLQLPDQRPAPILERPIGPTRELVIPAVELTKGRNTFTATIIGARRESEPSPEVMFILDQVIPRLELATPKDGEVVNARAATVSGKTQGRSRLVARNQANAASVTGRASPDGSFRLVVPIVEGSNAITLTITDPAGNVREHVVTVRRGTGKLTAALSAAPYRFRLSRLPDPLQLGVVVTDPDGRPLEGASITFTVSVPGIQVVTADGRTGANGRAEFRTTVPSGATTGQGLATVLVRTGEYGRTTDRASIVFTE